MICIGVACLKGWWPVFFLGLVANISAPWMFLVVLLLRGPHLGVGYTEDRYYT